MHTLHNTKMFNATVSVASMSFCSTSSARNLFSGPNSFAFVGFSQGCNILLADQCSATVPSYITGNAWKHSSKISNLNKAESRPSVRHQTKRFSFGTKLLRSVFRDSKHTFWLVRWSTAHCQFQFVLILRFSPDHKSLLDTMARQKHMFEFFKQHKPRPTLGSLNLVSPSIQAFKQ